LTAPVFLPFCHDNCSLELMPFTFFHLAFLIVIGRTRDSFQRPVMSPTYRNFRTLTFFFPFSAGQYVPYFRAKARTPFPLSSVYCVALSRSEPHHPQYHGNDLFLSIVDITRQFSKRRLLSYPSFLPSRLLPWHALFIFTARATSFFNFPLPFSLGLNSPREQRALI